MIKEKDITIDHFVHLVSDKVKINSFRKTDWKNVQDGINISSISVFIILQYILHKMVKQKSGKIIFTLSSNVDGVPAKGHLLYTVSNMHYLVC